MNLTSETTYRPIKTKSVLSALSFARVIALVTLLGGICGGITRAIEEVGDTKPYVFEGLVIVGLSALLGTFVMAIVSYLEWRIEQTGGDIMTFDEAWNLTFALIWIGSAVAGLIVAYVMETRGRRAARERAQSSPMMRARVGHAVGDV